jgi:nitrate reductase delta subunit
MGSAYQHVVEAVVVTLPSLTPQIEARMAELAKAGPPVEQVGLEPFPTFISTESIGVRR